MSGQRSGDDGSEHFRDKEHLHRFEKMLNVVPADFALESLALCDQDLLLGKKTVILMSQGLLLCSERSILCMSGALMQEADGILELLASPFEGEDVLLNDIRINYADHKLLACGSDICTQKRVLRQASLSEAAEAGRIQTDLSSFCESRFPCFKAGSGQEAHGFNEGKFYILDLSHQRPVCLLFSYQPVVSCRAGTDCLLPLLSIKVLTDASDAHCVSVSFCDALLHVERKFGQAKDRRKGIGLIISGQSSSSADAQRPTATESKEVIAFGYLFIHSFLLSDLK